ncbi:MAG: sigma-70 family RNA polymerase sigma factor [Planctomycetota bacterium]
MPVASRLPEDEELVQRSIAGSRDAFGLLVLRHARLVRAICMARIGSREVDDATQEVFLRAFRGLGRLEDPASFPSYLGRIARNYCIDRLRTAPRHKAVSLDEVELDPVDKRGAEESPEGEDRRMALRREIARLPESQRECLLLFYFEEMSYAQMAAALGVTEAAVNQRLSRARLQLRTALADRRGGELS